MADRQPIEAAPDDFDENDKVPLNIRQKDNIEIERLLYILVYLFASVSVRQREREREGHIYI